MPLASQRSSAPLYPPPLRTDCLQLYCLDAGAVAQEVGLGRRVNMVMQSAFFALSGVMSMDKVGACISGVGGWVQDSMPGCGWAVLGQATG